MFLRDIKLTNFRCFSDFWIHFENKENNRKHTLLLGQNGTGKSNLLKAIGLVTAGSNALGEILGNPDSWIRYGMDHCQVRAIITTAENEEREISLQIHRGDFLGDVIERNKESLSLIDRALAHAERNYFVLALGASRRLAGKSRSGRSEDYFSNLRSNNIATLFNREASLNSLENWAIDLDYKQNVTGLKIVRDSLKSFIPELSLEYIDKDTRQLIFKTPDGLLPLELLSDGYQNMTTWLGDLLYRVSQTFTDHKDPMKARGLLLIDEIDLHLHPVWQQKLLDFFRVKLPNFQLVATTHSPITAQQAEEGELYGLVREQELIRLVPFEGDPSKILINQLLMSPVFGLVSDESTRVQQLKTDYRRLKKKASRSDMEQNRFDRIQQEISKIPVQRPNSLLSMDDKQFLEDLRKTMDKKKSE